MTNLISNPSAYTAAKTDYSKHPADNAVGRYLPDYTVSPDQAKYWGSVTSNGVAFNQDALDTFQTYSDIISEFANRKITQISQAPSDAYAKAEWGADKATSISNAYAEQAAQLQDLNDWRTSVGQAILSSYLNNQNQQVTKVFDDKQAALDAATAHLNTLLNGSSSLQLTNLGAGSQAQGPDTNPGPNVAVPPASSSAAVPLGIGALLLFL